MFRSETPVDARLAKLEEHLERENPILLDIVKSFRELDQIAYRLGALPRSESFATRVPWWPMVAILGTFSSGKSSFVNYFLGDKLQSTGNQAVDDKFTVVCYGSDEVQRTLPGLALDADPRFPFYQMSRAIEDATAGEGDRIDAYLQLKTSRSEALRGKIFIDSPGFDADAQRTSTLRITDHIIDLSDLVLVFFDARHPEPGAMQDTLEHLVTKTYQRPDSNKFLYILNQIDNAAREDNPEEVFAAWQRALSQRGLTAGRFFTIYNPEAAIPIEDPKLRHRFEAKRAKDIAEIYERIHQVETERAYRIIGVLEKTAKSLADRLVPAVRSAKTRWKRWVTWLDGVVLGGTLAVLAALSVFLGYWDGLRFAPPWMSDMQETPWLSISLLIIAIAALVYVHYGMRKLAARIVTRRLSRDPELADIEEWVSRAFRANTRAWRSPLLTEPAGWSRGTQKRLAAVLAGADHYVQTLNNQFTNPSGIAADATESVEVAPADPSGAVTGDEPPSALETSADADGQPASKAS